MSQPESDARLFDVMFNCRSMRRFKPDPVSEEVLLQLVDAAIHAPSSSNGQNWRFVIVRDRTTKAKIAAAWKKGWAWYKDTVANADAREGENLDDRKRAQKAGDYMVNHLEETPAIIFVAIQEDKVVAKAISSPRTVTAAAKHLGMGGMFKLLLGASSAGKTGILGTAYPAAQNLLLAARGLGLGAVLATPHLFTPGTYEEILGMPKDVTLAAVIPVGYPMGKFGPVKRPDPASLVSWDHF
jgi:nitroreductase